MKGLGMKQISIIVSIISFTILLLAVIVIINFTKGEVKVDPLGEQTRVGLILNGAADDRNWNMSHAEALEKIKDDLNLEIVYRENVPEDETSSGVIRELVDEGCLIVIGTSYSYGESLSKAAEEFPDRCFMNAGGDAYGPNFSSFFGRMYQLRYLSGIVAGVQTKTHSIGYVASFPISEVNRGLNAFALGVRSVDPEAVIHVSFSGSWSDYKSAYDCTKKLINDYGADVIAMHTDSLAPLDAADEAGVWSVGCNYDNADKYPKTYLTGCVWNWTGYYREQILMCIKKRFRGTHDWLGIDRGIMELSDIRETGNADPACTELVEKARSGFEDHSFDVFYGPITDNLGNIRIPAGESMSDDKLYNDFDWYVQGVEITDEGK